MASRNTRNREMGARIRQRREELGMTLVDLSEAAGYPYSWQQSKVELSGVMPDPERLLAIAGALGKSVEWLITGRDSAPGTGPVTMRAWIAMLPTAAPTMARDLARNAWELAEAAQAALKPADAPSLTPPSRSASQSLVPPNESGMRSKRGAAKRSEAPTAKKRAR